MNVFDLIMSRRTIRQFKPESIPRALLTDMMNAARMAPSAANRQPLEFIAVDDPEIRNRIFPCVKWAAYIAPEGDPKPGQEPTAYVVNLVDTEVRTSGFEWDLGASIENMILTALERGVGSCWMLSIDRDEIREILNIPRRFKIDSVLALGYPAEESVAEKMNGDSVIYWKDDQGVMHVPKRDLEKIAHFNGFRKD